MKDNEKVELTAGDLRRAAEKCGTAKEVLKTLFPEVFKDEWEDISDKCELNFKFHKPGEFSIWGLGNNLFAISDGAIRDCNGIGFEVKIDDGRIWRRKSV